MTERGEHAADVGGRVPASALVEVEQPHIVVGEEAVLQVDVAVDEG